MKVKGRVPAAGGVVFASLGGGRGRPARDGAGTPVGRAGPGRAALPRPPRLGPPGPAAASLNRPAPLPRAARAGGRPAEEPRRPPLTQQPGRAWRGRPRRAPASAHGPPSIPAGGGRTEERSSGRCVALGPVRAARQQLARGGPRRPAAGCAPQARSFLSGVVVVLSGQR